MKREAGYIISGIFGIAICAGISIITGSIWTGYFAALFVGLIYLFWLDRKVLQNIPSTQQKMTLRVLIGLLVLAQFITTYMTYDHSQFMESNLVATRSSIDEGISKLKTQEFLLETLQHYYSQPEGTHTTIASSFREVMGDRLQADETLNLAEPTDLHFRYEIRSPDEVVITTSAKIGAGENPEFVNVSSQTGKYQAVATVTPNGIDYEREN